MSLRELDADYYTGNFHKWCCAPKGAGFLWARRERQHALRPLVTSHGARSSRTDRSRFLLEFDWTGTHDPTAVLTVPFALEYLEALFPGGWAEIRTRNRALALVARRHVAARLGKTLPCPDSMVGCMATLLLGEDPCATLAPGKAFIEPLYSRLFDEARIQVVVMALPALPSRAVRFSAHLYNDESQFERLAEVLARAPA